MAGRAARPPRLAAAGARHPLSGLSVRARRPVPETRADAARRGRAAILASRRSVAIVDFARRAPARGTSACSARCGWRPRCSIRALQRLSGWFVDTVLLHRPDYVSLRAASATHCRSTTTSPRCSTTLRALEPAFSARLVSWRELDRDRRDAPAAAAARGVDGAAIEMPVDRAAALRARRRHLTGGRRLLSDDHAALEADRPDRRPAHRRHPHHPRALRPRAS